MPNVAHLKAVAVTAPAVVLGTELDDSFTAIVIDHLRQLHESEGMEIFVLTAKTIVIASYAIYAATTMMRRVADMLGAKRGDSADKG